MGRLVSNQGGEEQERRHPPSPWFLTQGSMKDPEPLRNDNSKATYGETESSQNSRQGRKHWMKAERCLGRSWNVGTDPRQDSSETHTSRLHHLKCSSTSQSIQAEKVPGGCSKQEKRTKATVLRATEDTEKNYFHTT